MEGDLLVVTIGSTTSPARTASGSASSDAVDVGSARALRTPNARSPARALSIRMMV